MIDTFYEDRERIVKEAITIVRESGLASLSMRLLSQRVGISEYGLYRYFENVDVILVEIIKRYMQYDDIIIHEVEQEDCMHYYKVQNFMRRAYEQYAEYSDFFLILVNIEELMHNIYTRDLVTEMLKKRILFFRNEFQLAIEEGEIIDVFTPEELSNIFVGTLYEEGLNRRIWHTRQPYVQARDAFLQNLEKVLLIDPSKRKREE